VQVYRSRPDDFLLIFIDRDVVDRVLHAPPPWDEELVLCFRWWVRQSGVLFLPLRIKVLLVIKNIMVHTWSLEMVQQVVGSSCLMFNATPRSLDGSDQSRFVAAAWALHPDLILVEVGCIIPEPEVPFVEHEPSLFLQASEVIHSKQDTLQLWDFISILEVHD
jgi:hypothetical protein